MTPQERFAQWQNQKRVQENILGYSTLGAGLVAIAILIWFVAGGCSTALAQRHIPPQPKADAWQPPDAKQNTIGIGQKPGISSLPPEPPPAVRTRAGVQNGISLVWTPSPTPGVVGYRIHSGPVSGQYSSNYSVGNVNAATVPGQPGNNFLAATAVDGSGLESDLSNEILVYVAVSNSLVWYGTESATITAPMALGTNAGLPGVSSPTPEAGTATWTVQAPISGPYACWCRVLTVDNSSDSFNVSIDGTVTDIYDCGTNYSPAWKWSQLRGRTNGIPWNPILPIGSHTIQFRGREAGTWLAGFWLSSDTNWVPNVTVTNDTIVSFSTTLQGASTPTGPWTNIMQYPVLSLTNPANAEFIRSRVDIFRSLSPK